MALKITPALLEKTTSEGLARLRSLYANFRRDSEVNLDTSTLSEAELTDLREVFAEEKENRLVKAIDAIIKSRKGDIDGVIPNFPAFEELLRVYLSTDAIEGWVFVEEDDGKSYPYLVTQIGLHQSRTMEEPLIDLKLVAYSANQTGGESYLTQVNRTITFSAGTVSRRRVSSALASMGVYKETPSLIEEYEASLKRYRDQIAGHFAEQFRVSGTAYREKSNYYQKESFKDMVRHKVIHDLSEKDFRPYNPLAGAGYGGKSQEMAARDGRVPEHPLIRVFDLGAHESYWIHADYMEPYVYDKTLGEKLILPQSHRDLLEVLTTNLSDFTEDFIEGKSAGNVILCKGLPGVGKTLTAEIYSELIERPLYSIHSGTLGTTADQIERSLKQIYARAKRWNCVLLLDEADVFVSQRGSDVNKNAIVAEFLRTMEYFDGLMFMTTNRPDDIDDAIISRCIAVIEYSAPDPDLARRSWKAIEGQFGVTLDDDLREKLLKLFPEIVQRDIKMLLKLVLKLQKGGKGELTLDTFRRAAMFRAIKIAEGVA